MSKLTRALTVGVTLAAITFAGMTTAARADVNHDVVNRHRALGRLELPVAGDHDPRRPPTQGQVGESWRHRKVAPQDHAADAALGRVPARERSTIPDQTPAQAPAPVPAQPNRQRGWLLGSLGVLATALVLAGGLAALAARRARRRAPPPAPSPTR
jgi:hypothetical protein